MAIAYSSKAVSASEAGISSITFSVTTASLTNSAIQVGIGARDTGSTDYNVTGVTHNGDAMTEAVERNHSDRTIYSGQWYRVAPDVGTFNVVVSFAGTVSWARASASVWSGVDQSTPLDSTSSAIGTWEDETTPSVSHTTLSANTVVIDCAYDKNLLDTVGAGQTELYNVGVQSDDDSFLTSYKAVASTGTMTMSWGGGETAGEDWVSTTMAFKAATESVTVRLLGLLGVGV